MSADAPSELHTYTTDAEAATAEEHLAALVAGGEHAAAEKVARSLSVHYEQSEPDKACQFLTTAMTAIEAAEGTQMVDRYVVCLVDQAFLKITQRKVEESEEILLRARAMEDEMATVPHVSYLPMARVMLAKGAFDEAETLLTMAKDEQEPLALEQQVELDQIYATLAMVRLNSNPADETVAQLMDEAIEYCKSAYGDESDEVAEALTNKAMYFRQVGQIDETIATLRLAVDMYAALESPKIMQVSQVLVSFLASTGKTAEAAEVLDQLHGVMQGKLGDEHPMVANIKATADALRSGKMPPMRGGGHGHSHGGQPCHGHGGGGHNHGHSHSHGGGHDHGHSHSHGGGHDHGHSHSHGGGDHGHSHSHGGGDHGHSHGGAAPAGDDAGCSVM
ncbi:uncharacterized protein AMSG_03727 [Thecamonas trahens ATCC 50062]|uniref:Uncharacterized protein n=1 Tax=Thecamonas trahens ATCC 50062 TaxID=461836 RepID=A0A0L0D7L4_THETB|nr:hypothetical protein AMSG_03727 [Thecamonas trahens ATCC 50062]KNC47293.1 hypothetical protein AMSG_03727 [Thecamonas trahens ATCC 50062]|eukprot:XP_013759634.1 hypothetical protein AMSG_03727 [Thecamonas trahens ATCC 50062]